MQYVTVAKIESSSSSIDVPCVVESPIAFRVIVPNLNEVGSGDLVAYVDYVAIRESWIEENREMKLTTVRFPLGSFAISEDRSITLELPNFGNDVVANHELKHGHFEFLIRPARRAATLGSLVLPITDPSKPGRFLLALPHYPAVVFLELTTKDVFTNE